MWNLGLLGAVGATPSAYELISTTIITGSSTSSVTFSNLGDYSSTYKHLQLRYIYRDSTAGQYGSGFIRLNGDGGNNYTAHQIRGNGSSIGSIGSTGRPYIGGITGTGNTATANVFAGGIVDLLDAYSTTKNKTVRLLAGRALAGDPEVIFHSGVWLNTSSLTSLQVLTVETNFIAGSRFSLYGIKG